MPSIDGRDSVTLAAEFRRTLTDDILPFWLRHGLDKEYGGMLTGLGRHGEIIETDKSVWVQGRAAWTFATAYLEVEKRPEWLQASRSCIDFFERHCFDADGRMFFRVTREGKPVIKRRRYVFSETFAVAGMAAYARASGDQSYALRAGGLFSRILAILDTPGILEPKFNPATRPADGLALHMILIVTAQELRLALPGESAFLDALIAREIRIIEEHFMKPDLRCVLEQVGPGGQFQSDHLEGRLLNPGHAIEAAWFIMREARFRQDRLRTGSCPDDLAPDADAAAARQAENCRLAERWMRTGLTILDWMWERGWDEEHGGIIYFRDALGKSPSEYWHDMKFWWPQNEAIIATLMAFAATGEERHARRFTAVLDWALAHFPDAEGGEWFGYLHRNGSISTTLKGNIYKGPFHIPRMYLVCIGLLNEIAGTGR